MEVRKAPPEIAFEPGEVSVLRRYGLIPETGSEITRFSHTLNFCIDETGMCIMVPLQACSVEEWLLLTVEITEALIEERQRNNTYNVRFL